MGHNLKETSHHDVTSLTAQFVESLSKFGPIKNATAKGQHLELVHSFANNVLHSLS